MFRAQGLRNLAQSGLLLAGMAILLGAVGWGLAGPQGLALMLGAGVGFMVFGPNLSGRMVMRAVGAHRLSAEEAPVPLRLLASIARRANLSAVPALYYLPHPEPQAFTVGDRAESAAICLSEGMLRILGTRELAGVLAHEVSHIVNRDIYVMMLADLVTRLTRTMSFVGLLLILFNASFYMAGAEGGLPWWLPLVMVLAPTLSALMQLALARTREFEADRAAARLTADPDGLARALAILDARHRGMWERLFRPGGDRLEPSLLRTHPKTAERVARLRALARDLPAHDGSAEADGPPFQGFAGRRAPRRPPALWWWR